YTCIFAAIRRKSDRSTEHASALLTLAREHEMPTWLMHGTFLHGWARCCSSDREAGTEMREGLALARKLDIGLWLSLYGTLVAEVEADAGPVEAGLATLDAQLLEVEQTEERWFVAEMHRVRGELLLKVQPPDVAAAESALLRAIEIARSQHARTFELRAALSLAKLYQTTDRNQAACELLVAALAGFSASPELPEVEEAQRLLTETVQRDGASPGLSVTWRATTRKGHRSLSGCARSSRVSVRRAGGMPRARRIVHRPHGLHPRPRRRGDRVSNCDFMAAKSLIDLAASRLALRAPALRAATALTRPNQSAQRLPRGRHAVPTAMTVGPKHVIANDRVRVWRNADQCSDLLATDAAELGQKRDQRTGQQRSDSRHGAEQSVAVGERGIVCNDLDHALVEQIDIASKSANPAPRKTPQHRIFQQSRSILGGNFLGTELTADSEHLGHLCGSRRRPMPIPAIERPRKRSTRSALSALTMLLSRHTKRREFMTLLGGAAVIGGDPGRPRHQT